MANSFGGSIKLKGESEYTNALKTITSNLTVMSSEMKLVSAQYSSNDKSIQALTLTSRNNVLNKQIEEGKKKVDIYKSALEDFKVQQDKNGASLIELTMRLDASKSVEDFKDSEKQAGKETIALGDLIKGNLISEGIIAGIKGLVGAMKSVGTGLIDLGKQAINQYAEYEQLIGGVETLFKDSANVVSEYANNAYKTAGLSANES